MVEFYFGSSLSVRSRYPQGRWYAEGVWELRVIMDQIVELLRTGIIKDSMMSYLGLDNLLSKLCEVPVPTCGS